MPAFCDIWIGDKPKHKRLFNGDWEEVDNVWFSTSEAGKEFVQIAHLGAYKIILIGQLYEEVPTTEVLQRCIQYIEGGNTTYDDPAGHYILFIKNEQTNQTHVFTNRMGSYHAYWSEGNSISTYYLGLAKSDKRKELNWEAITGFMAMGYFPNDTTYIKDINIFEPASYYCFDASLKLQEKRRYWQWTYEPKRKQTQEYIADLQHTLRNSLSFSTANKRVAIPISGGLDSRLLAGELTKGNQAYKELKAFSYGYTESSPELKIANEIAEKRNIPLHSYVMPDYLFDEIDEVTEAVELFQYIDGTRQASAKEWLSSNADLVVGGHWGDVWMDSMHVDDDLSESFQKKIIKRGSGWLLKNICRPHIDKPHDYLNDYFNSFLNQHEDIESADFKMKIYKTDQWSFRWTAASLRMYQAGAMPILPFYDKRIVDLFCTIPIGVVAGRVMEIDYLKQYHEDLTRVNWQEYDADLYNYKYFNNRNIAYRAVKKVQRTLSKEKTIQRNWEVFFLGENGRKGLERYLLSNKQLNNIVPEQKVSALLDELYQNPSAANGYAVSMLLTFALFLNKVFD